MLESVADMVDSELAAGIWSGMHDAAPDIESEAEKKAAQFVENADEMLDKHGNYSAGYFKSLLAAAIGIIRALLAERGRIS
jgi:hypothetical protein